MTIEIDDAKGFLLYQDNGDGTITVTIKHPDSETYPEMVTSVINMSLETMMTSWGDLVTDDKADELLEKSTFIPNEGPE